MDRFIDKVTCGTEDLYELGREFFKCRYSHEDEKKFLITMLSGGYYNEIAAVYSCGFINKEYRKEVTFDQEETLSNLEDRYFKLFLETADMFKIDFPMYEDMLIHAFYVSSLEPLYKWQDGIRKYLIKLAKIDYGKILTLFTDKDKQYRCYSTLLSADKMRTMKMLTERLTVETDHKKPIIRKFLFNNKINLAREAYELYLSGDSRVKTNAVRLLVMYRNESATKRILKLILESEPKKSIVKIIDKSAVLKQKIKAEITDEQFFEDAMVSARDFSLDEFNEEILGVEGRYQIARKLFFTLCNKHTMEDLFVVENYKPYNLDNKEIQITEDKTIRVFHMADLPEKYSFIKRLADVQDSPQVKRKIFLPTQNEIDSGCVERLNGTVIGGALLRKNVKRGGFTFMAKEADGSLSGVFKCISGICAVISFSPSHLQKDSLITLGGIRFYNYSDLVKISGQHHRANAPFVTIASIEKRVFSELIYSAYTLAELNL